MGKKTTEEKIKEIAKGVAEAAEPILKDVIDKADPIIKGVKDRTNPIIKDMTDVAEPILKDVKGAAEPILNDVKGAAKTVGDNISIKTSRSSAKEEIFVQYGQHEIRTIDIMDKAKADYLSKDHKISDIKEIQVYIKPSDNAAYYVVNHSETGKIEF